MPYIHHVTVQATQKTAEVSLAPNSSIYLILMQARSQGLEFDLENSDIFSGGTRFGRDLLEMVRPNYNSRIVIVTKSEKVLLD